MSARAERHGVSQAARDDGASARRPVALTLRRAHLGDLRALQFFFDAFMRKDYFLRSGQLREILRGRYHQVYIAEIDCVLVGIAITTRGSRLINALVHPAYRGLGIGRTLIEASGAREARVKTNMSSGNPSWFYHRLGFRVVNEGCGETGRLAKPHILTMRRPEQRQPVTS